MGKIEIARKIASMLSGVEVEQGGQSEFANGKVYLAPDWDIPVLLHELGHAEINLKEGEQFGVFNIEMIFALLGRAMEDGEELEGAEDLLSDPIVLVDIVNSAFANEVTAWLKAEGMLSVLQVAAENDEYQWLRSEILEIDDLFNQKRERSLRSYLEKSLLLEGEEGWFRRLPGVRAVQALLDGDAAKAFELTLMPLKGSMRDHNPTPREVGGGLELTP